MLNERNQKILCAVVQSYIEELAPVGSRAITKKYRLNLSPATVRNIMADLEDMGFLSQPHTSAGRIPTDKGYRAYVDCMCKENRCPGREFSNIFMERIEGARTDLNVLLSAFTARLSTLSHYIAFASPVSPDTSTLNRIQLYKYRGGQAVAVIVTNEGIIKTKIIDTDFGFSQKDFGRISDYLNSEFSGCSINEIRSRMIQQMSKEKMLYDILISKAMAVCKEALEFKQDDVFISGLPEFLGLPDFSDRAMEMAKAIEDKHLILKLLEELSSPDGIRVVIGSENPITEMQGLSVVVAPYRQGDRSLGSLGIIGPTRMNYSEAMLMIKAAAESLSSAITGGR
ncbi:MAG: heat-inducible transcriptional repressor HrcA [Thermodesulfovibrionales bacterium]|nr:heat-inducible transcriptional repressor HrcA [Thermodesulfovibrionales bacterium]